MGKHYSHLSLDERIEIEKRRDLGHSARQIATALGRSPSTICRELKRGQWWPSNETAAYVPYRDTRLRNEEVTPPQYRAGRAQHKAKKRAERCHRRTRLSTDQAVTYLIDGLRRGWTPEMISGRVRLDHPDDKTMWACPETIYKFIYAKENRHRQLRDYLPRGHKKRRKHHGRRVHSSRIPNRVSIHHRPKEVNDRTVFGHWEGDSVLGTKQAGGGIHTEVERHSRLMMATKVDALTSREGVEAQKLLFASLPEHARVSTTMDNGPEMHLHGELGAELGMDTYFADPYSAWQRGTNEHHNGRLRRYYPKGTDFTQISETELQDVITEINNQPRKCLGWKTPSEAFQQQLNSQAANQCCTSK